MPRSLTNAYWIEVGTLRERERILTILNEWVNDPYGDFDTAIELIKGENNG